MNRKFSVENIRSLYWDRQFSIKQIADSLGISYWRLYGYMDRNQITRRLPSASNYVANINKPQFKFVNKPDRDLERLKIAGLMLYWAEGTFLGKTVDFVNSNPEMIKLFLRFLREICGVSEERLRVYLYAYEGQNIAEIKKYWSGVTGVSLSQFTKPYIRLGNPNLSDRKLPLGTVHIRYNDLRLLQTLNCCLHEYLDNWAGTQVAKGGRLSKGSVSPKGKMEK